MDPFTLGLILVVVVLLLGVRAAIRHWSNHADSTSVMPPSPEYVEAIEDLDQLKTGFRWGDIRG
jgi:hypothetical protein